MKVFVAGGTSGIGLATALKYLESNNEVGICGRDLSKLKLSKEYPLLKTYQLDIYDKKALEDAVSDFAPNGLDIMIISAGSYADDSLQTIDYKQSCEMLRVNIAGAVNALEVARCSMLTQGRIAVIASVSGLLNYPDATTYSKTKIALIHIAEAYRKALSNFGITITIVAPGYVNTQKLRDLNNDDLSKKPFVVEVDYATQQIVEGIEQQKELVVFPSKMKNLIQFISYLPSWLIKFIMHKKATWYHKK